MSFVYTHKLATSAESINDFQTTGIRREINPRVGGPKETRMNRVRLMYTGRYCEAAIARGEKIEDVDAMHTLRINNVFDADENDIRKEFEVFGRLGDVYRPINKDAMNETPFFFVRYLERDNMLLAMSALQGKLMRGRKMFIEEAKPIFELETSIY